MTVCYACLNARVIGQGVGVQILQVRAGQGGSSGAKLLGGVCKRGGRHRGSQTSQRSPPCLADSGPRVSVSSSRD